MMMVCFAPNYDDLSLDCLQGSRCTHMTPFGDGIRDTDSGVSRPQPLGNHAHESKTAGSISGPGGVGLLNWRTLSRCYTSVGPWLTARHSCAL